MDSTVCKWHLAAICVHVETITSVNASAEIICTKYLFTKNACTRAQLTAPHASPQPLPLSGAPLRGGCTSERSRVKSLQPLLLLRALPLGQRTLGIASVPQETKQCIALIYQEHAARPHKPRLSSSKNNKNKNNPS